MRYDKVETLKKKNIIGHKSKLQEPNFIIMTDQFKDYIK